MALKTSRWMFRGTHLHLGCFPREYQFLLSWRSLASTWGRRAWIHRQLSGPMESLRFPSRSSTAERKLFSRRQNACNSKQLVVIPVMIKRKSVNKTFLACHRRYQTQTFNIVALQLQSSISISPTWTAFSAVMWLQGAFNVPDSKIPRETRPRVTGDRRCKLTLPPPAKWRTRVVKQFHVSGNVFHVYLPALSPLQFKFSVKVERRGWRKIIRESIKLNWTSDEKLTHQTK